MRFQGQGLVLVAMVVASMLLVPPPLANAAQYTISGTVTGTGGQNVAGVLAYAYRGGSGATCCTPVTGAMTAGDGTYSFNVDPGSYRIRFYPSSGYAEEWFDNSPDFESATDVVVTASAVAGIDAVLTAASKITGTVTAAAGALLGGIGVHAMDATKTCCKWVTGTETDASGRYTLNLANGSYRLMFYAASGAYLTEWWDNAADFETATTIVLSGADVTGRNAQLGTGSTISGRVTSTAGAPLADVFVGAFQATTCCDWVAGAETDAAGNYSFAVPNGTYRLMFYPTSGSAIMEWWNDASDFDLATSVVVSGANVTGRNAQLGSGRVISGTVTAGATPLENVFVGAFRATGVCCDWVTGAGTDSQGKFSLAVTDGSYRLLFQANDGVHLSEWWVDAADFDLATNIVVSGADVTGSNASLGTGLKISGTVTAVTGGAPIEGVFVGAFASASACCEHVAGTGTDALGRYDLIVPSGSYKLMFYPPSSTAFLSEWWNTAGNAAEFAVAETIVVAGSSVTGKNAQLASGLSISGTVTAATGGAALGGVGVLAFAASDNDWAGGTSTNPDGTYSLVLPSGSYKLRFEGTTGYVSEWFDDKATQALATALTLSGTALTGKNAALSSGRILSGTVSDAAGALPGATALLYQGGSASCTPPVFVAATGTDGAGGYSFSVAAGTYRLSFSHPTHASEWFDDKADCASSTSVTVGTSDVTGKNAVLANAAISSLTGTVRHGTTSALLAGVTVTAQTEAGAQVGSTTTTATNGTYSISLPAGDYYIKFSKTGFVDTWYGGGFGGHSSLAAAVAAVSTATVPGASNIDEALPPAP